MNGSGRWQVLELLADTPVSRTWRVALAGPGTRPGPATPSGPLAVLRQDGPGARHLGLNRRDEPGVLGAAAAAGLGPTLIEADPAAGLLLTAWLPGRALNAAELREPARLDQAAALLRRLHGTPLDGPVLDLGEAIRRYAAAAGPAAAPLARAAADQLARCRSADPGPLCFCHNDPTPGNFVAGDDGALRLIDWEYAGLGHPGFDLAGFSVGAELGPAQVLQLHSSYRQRPPTADEFGRHRAWEALCRQVGVLWLAALESSPPGPEPARAGSGA